MSENNPIFVRKSSNAVEGTRGMMERSKKRIKESVNVYKQRLQKISQSNDNKSTEGRNETDMMKQPL